MTVCVERIARDASDGDVQALAALLLDAVADGAGISFLQGLTEAEATAWWREVLDTAAPRAVVLAAREGGAIVGTVQLQPAWAPNQPHRADVAKLLVHRRARGRGIARQLMDLLEREARDRGFSLLLLDTCRGGAAERLYQSMGWVHVGVVPGFALNADGSMCDTAFYYKAL